MALGLSIVSKLTSKVIWIDMVDHGKPILVVLTGDNKRIKVKSKKFGYRMFSCDIHSLYF